MYSNYLQMQCSKIEHKYAHAVHLKQCNACSVLKVFGCSACSVLKVFGCSACSVLNHLVCLASCVVSPPCCCCVGHSIITWWVHVILALSVTHLYSALFIHVTYTCAKRACASTLIECPTKPHWVNLNTSRFLYT